MFALHKDKFSGKDLLLGYMDFKNGFGFKKRKLIAGEVFPVETGVGLSKDLEMTFWTVMDIG